MKEKKTTERAILFVLEDYYKKIEKTSENFVIEYRSKRVLGYHHRLPSEINYCHTSDGLQIKLFMHYNNQEVVLGLFSTE